MKEPEKFSRKVQIELLKIIEVQPNFTKFMNKFLIESRRQGVIHCLAYFSRKIFFRTFILGFRGN